MNDADLHVTPRLRVKFRARLPKKLYKEHCWEWSGRRTTGGGYGKLMVNLVELLAHRVSWILVNGPIPDGLLVCHKCDNPPCCNPNHLFLGTVLDNVTDMRRKGRARYPGARNPNPARGDASGARKHPERLRRGDNHPSKLHPENLLRGEQHLHAKLTQIQVDTIRSRHLGGDSKSILSNEFGVSRRQISNIVRHKAWNPLPLSSS